MSPLSVIRGLTQEGTDKQTTQRTDTSQESRRDSTSERPQASITGPHDGRDSGGDVDHRYWRCERCGFESVDPALRTGCFRCGIGSDTAGDDDAE